jgi:hypothetical protein
MVFWLLVLILKALPAIFFVVSATGMLDSRDHAR